LYDLAAYSEYVAPIREEVETVVAKTGWTKSGMMRMYKLDSFIKEVLRYNTSAGIASSSMRNYT
jgi:hypothetical protein